MCWIHRIPCVPRESKSIATLYSIIFHNYYVDYLPTADQHRTKQQKREMKRANNLRNYRCRGAPLPFLSRTSFRQDRFTFLLTLCCLSLQILPFPISLFLRTPSSSRHESSHWFVAALPTGAASCVGGAAAVGGYHLDNSNGRPVLTGELAEGGVKVLLDNGLTLLPTVPTRMATGTAYELSVQTSDPRGFQGILMRLEDASDNNQRDMSNVLVPNDDNDLLQIATVCEAPIGGLTHTNSTSKTTVTASLQWAFPGTVYLDLTIVGINDNTASVYGYNRYEITIEGDTTTMAPSLPPGQTVPPTVSPAPTLAPTVPDVQGTWSPTFDPQRQTTSAARGSGRSSGCWTAMLAGGLIRYWLGYV